MARRKSTNPRQSKTKQQKKSLLKIGDNCLVQVPSDAKPGELIQVRWPGDASKLMQLKVPMNIDSVRHGTKPCYLRVRIGGRPLATNSQSNAEKRSHKRKHDIPTKDNNGKESNKATKKRARKKPTASNSTSSISSSINTQKMTQTSPCVEKKISISELQSKRILFSPPQLGSFSEKLLKTENIHLRTTESLKILNHEKRYKDGIRLVNEKNQHVFTLMPQRNDTDIDQQILNVVNVGQKYSSSKNMSDRETYMISLDRKVFNQYHKASASSQSGAKQDSIALLDWLQSVEVHCKHHLKEVDSDLHELLKVKERVSEQCFPSLTYAKNFASYCTSDEEHVCSILSPLLRKSCSTELNDTMTKNESVLIHACFPSMGIAVALRDGDILLFKPKEAQYMSISRRECWTNPHDVYMTMFNYS